MEGPPWQSQRMTNGEAPEDWVERVSALKQYSHNGKRAPHKPLLVLMALGRLVETGSSELPWSEAEERLAHLIAEFGPTTRTSRRQSAAYPFTHLRTDGIWTLSRDVPMDNLGPLDAAPISGRLEASLERALSRPGQIAHAARLLVDAQFPRTVAPDVLIAVGLDPDQVFAIESELASGGGKRQRSSSWPRAILESWDRQCAFCGYDGQLGSSSVGLEAAHVRWFNLGGPDDLNNGVALCSLHHKLFDRGALGLDEEYRILVSGAFSARTEAAKRTYDLHSRPLRPRRGTALPAGEHVAWHGREVFRGQPLPV
jgi:putative restriction endonuclease